MSSSQAWGCGVADSERWPRHLCSCSRRRSRPASGCRLPGWGRCWRRRSGSHWLASSSHASWRSRACTSARTLSGAGSSSGWSTASTSACCRRPLLRRPLAGRRPEWNSALLAVAMIALVAVPLGLLVAIAFYQFLDIDRLFSATLSYSLLAILGLALVLGVMPTASRAASDALGLAPAHGQILFALGLAAILVPAQRVVRPRIDRLLFPQRVALEQGFEQLLTAISSCVDMQDLTRLVGERLDALLHPSAAVVYARAGDVFTPLAVRGRPAPPAFAAQSALIAALQERTTPLAAERWTARRRRPSLPSSARRSRPSRSRCWCRFAADRARRLLVSRTEAVRRHLYADRPRLARRRRGQDLGSPARAGCHRRDRASARHAGGARRYVPAPSPSASPAARTSRPASARSRCSSWTSAAIPASPKRGEAEEIFHTVNRYTETVSQLVQARGGSVVEFHGDGLLGVFGAPEELPMKERAAVQVAATSCGRWPPAGAGDAGPALCRSGDRHRASVRRQHPVVRSLHLDGDRQPRQSRCAPAEHDARLDAAVAIDDTTFRRAGREAGAAFVRHADLAIRGRAQPETVHALPL